MDLTDDELAELVTAYRDYAPVVAADDGSFEPVALNASAAFIAIEAEDTRDRRVYRPAKRNRRRLAAAAG